MVVVKGCFEIESKTKRKLYLINPSEFRRCARAEDGHSRRKRSRQRRRKSTMTGGETGCGAIKKVVARERLSAVSGDSSKAGDGCARRAGAMD